ncbi:MAG: hypothetical protein ACRCU2_27815, partial [Planktothrix sp.]
MAGKNLKITSGYPGKLQKIQLKFQPDPLVKPPDQFPPASSFTSKEWRKRIARGAFSSPGAAPLAFLGWPAAILGFLLHAIQLNQGSWH